MVSNKAAYECAIEELRKLLRKIGRREFRAYGFSKQLRAFRARVARSL